MMGLSSPWYARFASSNKFARRVNSSLAMSSERSSIAMQSVIISLLLIKNLDKVS